MRDWAYIRRERKRRADPGCWECDGEGNYNGSVEEPCPCVMRAGDFNDAPDPLADEGNSDARELARDRS